MTVVDLKKAGVGGADKISKRITIASRANGSVFLARADRDVGRAGIDDAMANPLVSAMEQSAVFTTNALLIRGSESTPWRPLPVKNCN